MELEIDVASAEPVYEQIVRQVHQGVRQRTLAPGAPLPAIRQCAADLGLNPNTVAKAYKLLETDLVIRTAGPKGTFISQDAPQRVELLLRQEAMRAIEQVVHGLRDKGLAAGELTQIFNAIVARGFARTRGMT